MAKWTVGADRGLPIAQADRSWDGDAARNRIFAWAGWPNNPQPSKARRAFLIYDAENPENKGAYKLPFADVIDGQLKAIPSGLRAAASRLPQADAPADVLERARKVLDAYFRRMRGEAKGMRLKVMLPEDYLKSILAPRPAAKSVKTWEDLTGPEYLVLGVPFGGPYDGKDLHGEYFSPKTDIWLLPGQEVPVTYNHGFGVDAPWELQNPPVVIGVAKYEGADAKGHWFRVRLDPNEPLAQRIIEAADVKASSGAVAHLVRSEQGNRAHLTVWPVAELALLDVNEWRRPANPWAIAEPVEKAEAKANEAKAKAETGEAQSQHGGMKMDEKIRNQTQQQPEPEPTATKAETKPEPQPEPKAQPAPTVDPELVAEVAKQVATEVVKAFLDQAPITEPGAFVRKNVYQTNGKSRFVLGGEYPLSQAILAMANGQAKSVVIALDKPTFDKAYKALVEGTDTAGGYLVPPEHGTQIIELLNAQAVVRRAGATVINVNTNSGTFPKVTAGATAYWVGEASAITASQPTFGQVAWSVKKLAARVEMSRELVEDSNPSVEAIVRQDIATRLALAEDIAYLRGDGTTVPITGILNTTGVGTTTLGADGATPTFDDLADVLYQLDAANVPQDRRVFIIHPRTKNTLRKLKDSNGQYIWADPKEPGLPPTIWGIPVYETTQIPINLTVGISTDCSEIYLGRMPEAVIVQRRTIRLEATTEGAGTFENDTMQIKAVMRVGFFLRYPEAFHVILGVRP